jgi:outer membrane immunogenic protein
VKKIALFAALCLPFSSAMADSAFVGPYAGASIGFFQGTATATEYNGFWDYGEYTMNGDIDLNYGVQGGYNFAVGKSGIVGLELSYAAPQFEEKRTFNTDWVNTAEWKSVISLSAKGGVVVDQALIYATAGLSQVDAEYAFGDPTTPSSFVRVGDDVLGMSVGVGVEFAVSDNLSVRAEYTALTLESSDTTMSGEPGNFQSSATNLGVGLNFLF